MPRARQAKKRPRFLSKVSRLWVIIPRHPASFGRSEDAGQGDINALKADIIFSMSVVEVRSGSRPNRNFFNSLCHSQK